MKNINFYLPAFLVRSHLTHQNFPTRAANIDRPSNLRRTAWLSVFAVSALFWIVVALMIWYMWS